MSDVKKIQNMVNQYAINDHLVNKKKMRLLISAILLRFIVILPLKVMIGVGQRMYWVSKCVVKIVNVKSRGRKMAVESYALEG